MCCRLAEHATRGETNGHNAALYKYKNQLQLATEFKATVTALLITEEDITGDGGAVEPEGLGD